MTEYYNAKEWVLVRRDDLELYMLYSKPDFNPGSRSEQGLKRIKYEAAEICLKNALEEEKP